MANKRFQDKDPGQTGDRGQHSLFDTERLEDYAALVISALILLLVLILF
jgi:hypothetical protein